MLRKKQQRFKKPSKKETNQFLPPTFTEKAGATKASAMKRQPIMALATHMQ
ncbi:hypothetical protein ACQKCU_18160 [Heyndrickxia sporothermodurans]